MPRSDPSLNTTERLFAVVLLQHRVAPETFCDRLHAQARAVAEMYDPVTA